MKTFKHQDSFIKFNCHLIHDKIVIPPEIFAPLNYWRNELWLKSLIGAYHDGVGYGNISARVPESHQFYISGTATGGIPELDQVHYPLVERCEPAFNALWCRGLIKASSESMSHAAIYSAIPEVGAVVHIHSRKLWDKNLHVLPTTAAEVQYGTPKMAYEIGRILTHSHTLEKKVIVMGGHDEGIMSFGKTLEDAALAVLNLE